MNTLKRYLCLFLVIALLFTSGFAPFVTVTATEFLRPDSSGVTETGAAANAAPYIEPITETRNAAGTNGVTDANDAAGTNGVTDTRNAPDADGVTDTNDAADTNGVTDTRNAADTNGVTDTNDAAGTNGVTDAETPPYVEPVTDTRNAADADGIADANDAAGTNGVTDAETPPYVEPVTETRNAADTNSVTDAETPPYVEPVTDTDALYTYSFTDGEIEVTAEISHDSVFSQDETELNNDEIHLEVDTTENERFSQLLEDYDGEALTVDLSFRTEDGETVEQINGSTELTLTIPATDENTVIQDVEVYHYAPGDEDEDASGKVEQVEEITVDSAAHTVSFNAEELGAYAVRYTVDFYFEGREFHMVGGATLLLSELFRQLRISRDAADVEQIDFTDESLIQFTRYDDGVDWVIKSLAPFDTEETLTLIFADGERLVIPVTDDQTAYSETPNLAGLMTNWKLTVGDTVFSDKTVDKNTVIEYKEGMQYSLELIFAEKPTLGFYTPDYPSEENPSEEPPPPEMFYQLPDLFYVPSDFTVPLIVKLGRKGVLADNIVTVAQGSISGGTVENNVIVGGTFSTEPDEHQKTHEFIKLTWNWKDTTHWKYFCDSSQANLTIIVNGVFQDEEPHVLSINGKDIIIRKEDLRNAIVNKEGSYNPDEGVIRYTVKVTSQGTTSDITLTDTLGSALTYQGDVDFDANASVNSAETTPQITRKTGNTFNVLIPAMQDGDCLVFHYSVKVDYDGIAVSGAPTFEETGNTAQIVGDSYTLDNLAQYHETNIEFSDLEKNCINKKKQTIAENLSYILTWEIDTNKRAQYPLADTTITDTISPNIQEISKYTGSGVVVECYSKDNTLCDTRRLTWDDLGVNLSKDISWTYRIPDTDPPYRYKLTYDTVVDMSSQTETLVAENTAEGKGGIDSDRAVLPPPGPGGIDVTKKATDIGSTHVTWEIRLTVSGTAFDYARLALTEHCDVKEVTTDKGVTKTTWSANGFPIRWMTKPGDEKNTVYKEALTKVEVVGLQSGESFQVTYGPSNSTDSIKTYSSATATYDAEEKKYVLTGFTDTSATETRDVFQLEFFKDSADGPVGNLIKPDGDNPSRTIVVRLTTKFSDEWALTARDISVNDATRNAYNYSHINWISADTPDASGINMISRAMDTDKFLIIPPRIYKTVQENADTTDPTRSDSKPEKYLLDYPNCYFKGSNDEMTGADAAYADAVAFPTFRYAAIVSGIQFDEPLVIEDKFDTSLFELI